MPKRALTICALLILFLGGCFLGGCAHHPPRAGAVSGPTAGTSTNRAGPVESVPSTITPDEGTLVLAQFPMSQTPDYTTPELAAEVGDLEITSICTGAPVTITIIPLNGFVLPCAANSFTPTRNVITLSRSTVVKVHVQADPRARWNLLVALRPAPRSTP